MVYSLFACDQDSDLAPSTARIGDLVCMLPTKRSRHWQLPRVMCQWMMQPLGDNRGGPVAGPSAPPGLQLRLLLVTVDCQWMPGEQQAPLVWFAK
jgi:hypothetical protein